MAKTLPMPPPKYLAPHVSEEVPPHTRTHIQLLYQKIGELTQAITIQQQAIDKLNGGGK